MPEPQKWVTFLICESVATQHNRNEAEKHSYLKLATTQEERNFFVPRFVFILRGLISSQTIPRHITGLLFAIGGALLAYTGVRAACLAFTYDEIASLQDVQNGFILYPQEYGHMSANNHWLNSFFLWLFSKMTTSEFILRSPQLIAHALFLLFSARIILLFRQDFFAVAAFVIVNVHPYLLDFFSLARGYGLSLGCMMAALYFLVSMQRSGTDYSRLSLLLLFSALAVFSSFVLLNFFIAALSIAGLLVLLSKESPKQKAGRIALLAVSAAALLLLVVPHLLEMKKADALYHGETELWSGTVQSLADRLMYSTFYTGDNHFEYAKPLALVMLAMMGAALVAGVYKNGMRAWFQSVSGCFTLLLAMIVLLSVVQAKLFDSLYPKERTAIFLLVIFLFSFLAAVDALLRNKLYGNLLAGLLCIPLLFHFVNKMNNTYALDWIEAGNSDKIIELIAQDRSMRFPGQTVTVSSSPVVGFSAQYIARQRNETSMELYLHWNDSPLPEADYYIVEKRYGNHQQVNNVVLLYKDELTGNQLFADTTAAVK